MLFQQNFQQTIARFSKNICTLVAALLLHGALSQLSAQAPDSLAGMKGFWVNVGTNYSAAFKYWTSPRTAVVAGVNVFGSGASVSSPSSVASNFSASVFGRFQYFLSERRQFMPYLSVGGQIGNATNWNAGGSNNAFSLGLTGGGGMECFILPWLSVAGELNVGGTFSVTRSESTIPGINPFNFGNWSAGLANSGIIFTIYF